MGMATCRKVDPELTIAKVIIILTKMVTRLNIDRNMNASQIRYCAEDIVHSDNPFIYNLTLDELSLCMDKGVRGEYGEIYNRMDQAVVFGWIEKYIQEKSHEGEKLRIEHEQESRKNIHEIFQNETMETILKDVHSKLIITEAPAKEIAKRELTEAEKQMQEFLREFDQLYRTNGRDFAGSRFVQFQDEWVDQKEYVGMRIEQWNEQVKS
jgi:hypothetical protein